ncbi:MAG: hypothetical protein IH984_12205 [Planctomycetes bacterium]|nr:hypothetical protein [Planctomycetota bacterium]
MKRRLFKLVLFFLLGAIVNVAVAWGSSVFIGFEETINYIRAHRRSPVSTWNIETFHRISAFRVKWFRSRKLTPKVYYSVGPLPEDLVPTWIRYDPELNENRRMEFWDAEARGWPLLVLWSKAATWYEALDGTSHRLPIEGGIELSLSPFAGSMAIIPKVLPLRPIWPGFAINTIFYAAIVWLMWLSPFAARRIIRHKRNL